MDQYFENNPEIHFLLGLYRSQDDGPSSLGQAADIALTLRDGVRNLMFSRDGVTQMYQLPDADKATMVDVLCKVISEDEDVILRKKVFRSLRKLCSSSGYLPGSYFIASESLVHQSRDPVDRGGHADVYHGRLHNADVALKVFRFRPENREATIPLFYKEAVCWKYLSHPNVVPFIGIERVEESALRLCLVSQWMRNGNLFNYLRTVSADRIMLLLDIAAGLQYLHSVGIVHGDLKSFNVLINDNHRACLTDFGLATVVYDTDTVNVATHYSGNIPGTLRWTAPELMDPELFGLTESRPSPESDIYSFAMVMLEAFTGAMPFSDVKKEAAVLRRLIGGSRPSIPADAVSRGLSADLQALMQECWNTEPGSRPTAHDVLRRMRLSADQGTQPPLQELHR